MAYGSNNFFSRPAVVVMALSLSLYYVNDIVTIDVFDRYFTLIDLPINRSCRTVFTPHTLKTISSIAPSRDYVGQRPFVTEILG